MSNMGSSLPSRGRKADEGVAIPCCALMASSSLEELGNSAVITFSSGRRQPEVFLVYRCFKALDVEVFSCL